MSMNPRLLRPILSGDPDALRYIAAVQAADGNTLETAVRKAINDFVVGCKQDGIWSAIKASCLLAGPRTLAGINVPLVGPTPTFNAFTADEYDRETGLKGNASTMFINANRNQHDDPQDFSHLSVYVSEAHSVSEAAMYIGGSSYDIYRNSADLAFRSRVSSPASGGHGGGTTGFLGHTRATSANYSIRANGATSTINAISGGFLGAINVFRRGSSTPLASDGRLAFYSIGESLDLALLDARVSAYLTAIDAAI